jgi:methylated-DNA-[protein]-cysteine S-methyltransferase
MDSFDSRVYSLLRQVPKGKVTTYRDVARALGMNSYRCVGQALRRNPHAPAVPCHRVVKSNGEIGGFGGEIRPDSAQVRRKKRLLRSEGVVIVGNKIDIEHYRHVFRGSRNERGTK